MGRRFTESPVKQQPIFCLRATALRQKMWKQGLPYSTTGSLESGMKEMNAAANHFSLFTGSFSKPLLAFQLFGGGEEGRLADMHLALQNTRTILHTCSHFFLQDVDISIFAQLRVIKPNSDLLTWLGEWKTTTLLEFALLEVTMK